jgi:hypothetical protein
MSLLSILALIAGAMIFGINRYPTHALMPLFLITSIWLIAQARNAAPPAGQIRRFVILAISIAIVAFFGRAANMYVQHPVCNICRWGIPYAELAHEMQSRGFTGEQILVDDKESGGNLHRFFPEARIMLSDSHVYAPPLPANAAPAQQTAILWSANRSPQKAASNLQRLVPGLTASQLARAETITLPWSGQNWFAYGHPVASWRLLLVDGPLTEAAHGAPQY